MGRRVVLIGAGSAVFGYNSVLDAVNLPVLKGSSLVLHDIDAKRLETMTRLAERMCKSVNANLEILETISREEALEGADFVVLSIAVDRMRRWRLDWEIPYKHGIRQVIGENGGPGGLFHTLRMVPIVMDICGDIERICPDALLLNYTNPVPRLCQAISKYTEVKAIGLCHEVEHQLKRLSPIIGVPTQLLDATSAGLNHFSWFKELRFKNGDDAYPHLEKGLREAKGFQPLCKALYKKFGLFPSTDDNHAGEYLAYAWEACPPGDRGVNWINKMERKGQLAWENINSIIDGMSKLDIEGKLSGEGAMRIIAGIVSNSGHLEPQVNMANKSQISNLLSGAIVETPAIIDMDGVHPIDVGELPPGVAALCNIQIMIQNLAVQAAIEGDKNIALKAMLSDPVVNDGASAEVVFRELFEAHKDMLPQFRKG